jgi:hypothetical protein
MKHMGVVGFAMALLASACLIKNTNTNEQSQGISGSSSSSISDPNDPACRVTKIQLGTVADASTVRQGFSVGLVVTLIGQQGLELVASCRDRFSPAFFLESTPTPAQCTLEGSGFNTSVRALDSAVLGTSCSTVAQTAGQVSAPAKLTVVLP